MREATASRAADLAVGVMGAQQRLPRSFLSPVPVLPTSDQASRRGSLCADHSPDVLPTRRLPRASGRFRNVSSSPRDCTCSARITVMTRPRRVEQDEGTYIEQFYCQVVSFSNQRKKCCPRRLAGNSWLELHEAFEAAIDHALAVERQVGHFVLEARVGHDLLIDLVARFA